MATKNELAAFEDFEFKIGDLVRFKSNPEVLGIVVGMILLQNASSIGRSYMVRSPITDWNFVRAIELDLVD
jgi:hypothetical protein